jgi:hypothetical protein
MLGGIFEVGANQIDVADAQRQRELIKRDHGRIAPTALQAAEILLAKARTLLDLLLGQALIPPQAREIPANQFTHVHAQQDRDLHTLSLSTSLFVKGERWHTCDRLNRLWLGRLRQTRSILDYLVRPCG